MTNTNESKWRERYISESKYDVHCEPLHASTVQITETSDTVVYKVVEIGALEQARAELAAVKEEIERWKNNCPECGSGKIREPEENHKQCENCHQEFFDDVDYSDVVFKNLSKLTEEVQRLTKKLETIDRANIIAERRLHGDSSDKMDASQEAAHYNWLDEQNEKLTEKLRWLVSHSIERAAISKAKGAEILEVPLIDLDLHLAKLEDGNE